MEIPLAIRRGWRQSMRTEAWYRQRQKWVAIVVTDDDGFRLILKRTERSLADAIAAANKVLTDAWNR